jgi:hypothetical protein
MPAIRIAYPGSQREAWVRIYDQHLDNDGYLQFFTILDEDGTPTAMHLVRHDISLMDFAFGLFSMGTQLRSARGLMQDLAKQAREEKWVGKAGAVGIAFGSAAILYEFLKTRRFDKEGYYRADGTLFLGRKIHSRNSKDYDPRKSDRD